MRKLLLLIFVLILLFACTNEGHVKRDPEGEVENGGEEVKVLVVIAQDQFRDEEALEPINIFKEAGYEVTVASTSADTAKGMLGAELEPDITLDQVNPDDYDMLSITGGMGSPQYLWDNEKLHAIVRSFNDNEKVFGAICLSPVVLVKTGILDGKEATCYVTDDVKNEFENKDVTLKDDNVFVTDGRIITGNGPHAAGEYANKIIEIYKSRR